MMVDRYEIRDGYVAREVPQYDDQHAFSSGLVYQPDVYTDAAAIARATGSPRLIDVGSGNGAKLIAAAGELSAIGLDFGANLESCRKLYPAATWREFDADRDAALPVSPEELDGAVMVCADVIEHLVEPAALLRQLRHSLDRATAVVLSTPDRDLIWGPGSPGPPPNPHHIREWSRDEFVALLRREGFQHGLIRHTREHDRRHDCRCIEAILVADPSVLRKADLVRAADVAGLILGRPGVSLRVRAGGGVRRVVAAALRLVNPRVESGPTRGNAT